MTEKKPEDLSGVIIYGWDYLSLYVVMIMVVVI